MNVPTTLHLSKEIIRTALIATLVVLPLSTASATTTSPATTVASSDSLAYMKLELTARDDAGGEISTDGAISLYFRPEASKDWDRYDASKLLPRGDTWAVMAFEGTKGGEDVLKAQESRPHEDNVQVVDIKLVQKNMPAATYTLRVQQWYSVPADWSLKLRSQALDTTFVIEDETDTATFDLGASKAHLASAASDKTTSDTTHVSMAGEVGPTSSALPVELSSFAASLDADRAALEWETLSETNNSGFAVQHRAGGADAGTTEWSRLGFVEGEGTTDQRQSYRFTTPSLEPGTHTFRLKQIDRDGTTHFTEAVHVERTMDETVNLSTGPNPFVDQLTVSFTTRSSESVTVQLFDMLGRMVKQSGPITTSAHSPQQLQFDGDRLSAGSYLLRVEGETFTTTRHISHVR